MQALCELIKDFPYIYRDELADFLVEEFNVYISEYIFNKNARAREDIS